MEPNTATQAQPGTAAGAVEEQLRAAEAGLIRLDEQVKQFIRAHPGACLLGAAAVGFLVGRWASRR